MTVQRKDGGLACQAQIMVELFASLIALTPHRSDCLLFRNWAGWEGRCASASTIGISPPNPFSHVRADRPRPRRQNVFRERSGVNCS